uniref:Uncharacterized protein n=1 Tax=Aegilops tauschii subsp. strangulata TaxID=200361 RepID=A0A453S5U5_AEGTS
PLPDVRVEFAGANLVLKTVSHRAPGQAVKIIAALESRAPALEILHAKISTIDDTDVNAFTVKDWNRVLAQRGRASARDSANVLVKVPLRVELFLVFLRGLKLVELNSEDACNVTHA